MAIYSGFSHWKWWFSIAMLNYQRVYAMHLYPAQGSERHICASSFIMRDSCPWYPPNARISPAVRWYLLPLFHFPEAFVKPGFPSWNRTQRLLPHTYSNPKKDQKKRKVKLHYLIGIYFLFFGDKWYVNIIYIYVYMCACADILFACSMCNDMWIISTM